MPNKSPTPKARYADVTIRELDLHIGLDYAVVMSPDQTTDNASIRLYGSRSEIERLGALIVAAPDLLAAAKAFVEPYCGFSDAESHRRIARSGWDFADRIYAETLRHVLAFRAAIQKAEG